LLLLRPAAAAAGAAAQLHVVQPHLLPDTTTAYKPLCCRLLCLLQALLRSCMSCSLPASETKT
jgi:hypothetical protein